MNVSRDTVVLQISCVKIVYGVQISWFGPSTKIYHGTRILNTIEEACILDYITWRQLFDKYLHVKVSKGLVRCGGIVVSRASVCEKLARETLYKRRSSDTDREKFSEFVCSS